MNKSCLLLTKKYRYFGKLTADWFDCGSLVTALILFIFFNLFAERKIMIFNKILRIEQTLGSIALSKRLEEIKIVEKRKFQANSNKSRLNLMYINLIVKKQQSLQIAYVSRYIGVLASIVFSNLMLISYTITFQVKKVVLRSCDKNQIFQ